MHIHPLVPSLGILIFNIIYIIVSFMYKGGSRKDIHAKKFSWLHNYWCDLMETNGYDGQPNPSKKLAIGSVIFLSFMLALLWFQLPDMFMVSAFEKALIRYSGMMSMLIAGCVFTRFHTPVIYISGILSLVFLSLTFHALYLANEWILIGLGIFFVVICILNYYVYYTKHYIDILPLIQKLAFLLFFLWCIPLNWRYFEIVYG